MALPIHEQIENALREREQELIQLHQVLVAIPTVNRGDGASAEETKLAEAGAEYLHTAGIQTRTMEGTPGRGNLLAEFGDGSRSMLWMSHADVVPPGDESAWTHPPFSAALENGRIWGRGSNDCKMLVAAQLFAMACLARLGLPRKGRLKLAVGADEEVGGQWGFGWLLKEHKDFLKADLAICEGGGSSLGRFEEGLPVIGIGSGEKGRYDVIFKAKAEGGHASSPWGKRNPLLILTEVASRISAWQPRPVPASPIFKRLGRWVDLPEEITEETLEESIRRIEVISPSLANSLRGQSRMTMTPTVIHSGDKANAIPTEAELTCDARLLPGQTKGDLEHVIANIMIGISGVDVTIKETTDPSVSPFDESLRGMFERATTRAIGAPARITPTWCVGATDAHFVRAAGTPVYGYQLIHPDADPKRLSIHCIDESIEVKMLLPCALSLAHVAAEFLEGES